MSKPLETPQSVLHREMVEAGDLASRIRGLLQTRVDQLQKELDMEFQGGDKAEVAKELIEILGAVNRSLEMSVKLMVSGKPIGPDGEGDRSVEDVVKELTTGRKV